LPAPFGPPTPRISPWPTVKLNPSTAAMAPKWAQTASQVSSGPSCELLTLCRDAAPSIAPFVYVNHGGRKKSPVLYGGGEIRIRSCFSQSLIW
jgi:hypothetical protein